MSNIYHLEPPTKGKVVLHTSYGDVDVELWAREGGGGVGVDVCVGGCGCGCFEMRDAGREGW
jgi:hypothetical protein